MCLICFPLISKTAMAQTPVMSSPWISSVVGAQVSILQSRCFFSHLTWSSLGCTALDTRSLFRIMRYGGISLISQENMCFNIVYNILTGGGMLGSSRHVIQIEVRGQLMGVLSLHRVGTRDHTQCCLIHGRAFFQPSANPNLHAFKN